jgi:hypothetical protein
LTSIAAGAAPPSRWRRAGLGAAAALTALLAALLLLRDPGISADTADGTYWHDCCGDIVLNDGRMKLGEKTSVSYVVGQDETGPFVLPKRYVGTWEDRGFEIDGSRPPLKLRLDALPHSTRIVVPAARGSYIFERKAPRRR